jgi:hypothetical protein
MFNLRRQNRTVARRRPPLYLESLKERSLLSSQPLSLADPSLWGASGLKDSAYPSVSSDGQLIAFASQADDLVPNDTNGQPDAFVYNRTTGTVTLVSVGLDGTAAGIDPSSAPLMSPDGRYVIFESGSGTIVSGVATDQLFLRDLSTGATSLLSVAADGGSGGTGVSYHPVFSADSHHVAFLSSAGNLVSGVTFDPTLSADHKELFERD